MKPYNQYKNVYCSGIGGIGVSAMARLFKYHGVKVSGSDFVASTITADLKKMGIKIYDQQSADNITAAVDLFIYTPALPADHPEKKRARELNIPSFSYPEILGKLSKEYDTIAISGTHGKSTTTALLGLILTEAKLDPTVIVGSQVKKFDHNLRVGKSNLLVVEACEYRGHMLTLSPQYELITNIEVDHLDYYKDLDDIIDHFDRFIRRLADKDNLIVNLDNKPLARLNKQYGGLTFGLNESADIRAENIKVKSNKQYFDLVIDNRKIEQIQLTIPGVFNVYNCLGAIAMAHRLGVKAKIYKKVLAEYSGCWRRFERLGSLKNIKDSLVISDYAHHPTAVKETIKAAKEFYPNKRLIAVYQPHQHNRTKKLFKEFTQSFSAADYVILSEIYDVKGRGGGNGKVVSSNDLVNEIIKNKLLTKNQIIFCPDLDKTKEKLLNIAKSNDVILIMGAGDIDTMARKLVNS